MRCSRGRRSEVLLETRWRFSSSLPSDRFPWRPTNGRSLDDDGLVGFDRHRLDDRRAHQGNDLHFVGPGIEQETLREVAEFVDVTHESIVDIHGGEMVGILGAKLAKRRLGRW